MPLARGSAAALLVLLLLSDSAPAACHATATEPAWNVTAILAARRGLAEFTRALAATGLADAVNSNVGRGIDAVTVLAVDDARMAETRGALQREALRRALSRHVLAGYYDDASLRRLLTLTGEVLVVAPTLLGETPVKILSLQGPDAGRVAFAPMDHDDARVAAVFYVGPVAHDSNVSVLLVSGVMWAPLSTPPAPRLQVEPSNAPASPPPEQAGSSSGGAVTSTTKFQAHQDGAPETAIPARQVTPRRVSAMQEEGGVSSPAAVAASPPEPGPTDSTAPAPPERDLYDTSILTIFGVLLVCYLAVCCCSQ